MAGLYVKFHQVYVRSKPFIKFNKISSEKAEFEDLVILKVDAQRVVGSLKNRNMARSLHLIAQGFLHWEIAEMLKLSERTVDQYVYRFKKYLQKV
jgi:DNA-binding NarL/FixJ family response regulator